MLQIWLGFVVKNVISSISK